MWRARGDQGRRSRRIRQHNADDLGRKSGIALTCIWPGKPQQNVYVERYNRTIRQEWLELYIVEAIKGGVADCPNWLSTYNNERPNLGSGAITPAMKLKMAV